MTDTTAAHAATEDTEDNVTRRDFINLAAVATTGVGVAFAAWPFIDQLNPDASVRALASIEVDLSPIEVGQAIKVMWRGKPVFIRRRTEQEIAAAEATPLSELPDPQPDDARVRPGPDGALEKEWLILVGVCTHLGCVPLGTDQGDNRGNYGGWFCPCHGSHYDTAGRIRQGPAPRNLEVPEYAFLSETRVRIG